MRLAWLYPTPFDAGDPSICRDGCRQLSARYNRHHVGARYSSKVQHRSARTRRRGPEPARPPSYGTTDTMLPSSRTVSTGHRSRSKSSAEAPNPWLIPWHSMPVDAICNHPSTTTDPHLRRSAPHCLVGKRRWSLSVDKQVVSLEISWGSGVSLNGCALVG